MEDVSAQEHSDAKASDDIGADFEVISASEAKDAPDEEEEPEAESEEAEEDDDQNEEAEEEGEQEECEAEDEEAEAEEDDSAQKYASARDEELLKSAKESIYKSAYDSKPASTAKRQKWSEKLKSPSRTIGSFGFAPALMDDEEEEKEPSIHKKEPSVAC